MSQAFVKEGEEQWLHEIQPTVTALILHLTRENNGIRVYEQKQYMHPKTMKDVVPYLMRRAQENSSMSGQTGKELQLIKKELERRKYAKA